MNGTSQSEINFLSGPQSRWADLKFSIDTFFQMIRGFRALHVLPHQLIPSPFLAVDPSVSLLPMRC